MTFSDVQKELIGKGCSAWSDPDYRAVVEEDLWKCPNGCDGHRQLRGFKNADECRAFAVCFACGRSEEI
jgi:hypothetical protein|tara:strand:- start:501 stop:707 length:207 start_codon:yes stop_codon:yes gene_type:complete